MKQLARRVLHTPRRLSVLEQIHYFVAQRVLRINGNVPWPVHFTSRVVAWDRIRLGLDSTPGDMPNCYIQGMNGIIIGDGCEFGPGVGLISANHNPIDLSMHLPAPPIRIANSCWIGMNAVILPGVELGERTIVGAGSVVTKSFPDGNCVIAGNPARVVKQL